MATHWLDAFARAMASTADRRRFLVRTGRAAVIAGVAPVLTGARPSPTARAAAPSVACRYLCDGTAVGRAAPGRSSVLVWVTPVDACPARAGCAWLQRIEISES
jgi:hypothetical protein